jgi:protein-tyrosine phosphatase
MKKKMLQLHSQHWPLMVDWVEKRFLGTQGRIGMTLCPGRVGQGATQFHRRSVAEDVKSLMSETPKVDAVVGLMEAFEYRMLGTTELPRTCRANGIDYLWFPIRDGGTPQDMRATRAAINTLVRRLRDGESIVVHCKAGLGRTGLIVACVLVRLGWTPRNAVAIVRGSRKGTIENRNQEQFVVAFEGRLSAFSKLPE